MAYYARKTAGFLVTLLLVSLVTFAVFQILPGDPATAILGVDADPVQVEQLRKEIGADQPLPQRFLSWAGGVLRGDLGTSYQYRQPVAKLISGGLSVTVSLAVFSLILTALIGIPTGLWLARHGKKLYAAPVTFLSQLGLSVPAFCMSIVLIEIFSVQLRWLPSLGFTPWTQSPVKCLQSLLLPAIAISFGSSAVLIRYVRASVSRQEGEDYVRTAKSKGAAPGRVMWGHVLRNSLIPVLTIFGMIVTDVLGGSIIIENVFSLPGIGRLISTSIATRDLPLIQGLVLYLAGIVVVCNFAVDLLYSVIDPRIRLK
ncbi:ABC transporter permease [Neglectibacter caecimuris]|uniref:ABC transporter permease n=1 Tax=Neglectibacter caecimuris TaxID=3093658 RepID=UPI002AC8AC76|nr:ABC transporter permease [Neglectibacter sp. M00184]